MSGWTDERVAQLEKLEELLHNCEVINSANGVVERLQFCIKTASELKSTKLRPDFSVSFLAFLRELAVADRAPQEPGR